MLCDTSVLVDIDRGGVERRVTKLDETGRHAISAVTVTELRLGVNKRYERGTDAYGDALDALDRLLARFEIVDVTRSAAATAADLIDDLRTRGDPLHDLHDVYVAACALVTNQPVLTANVADFERIDGVTVVDWTEY